MDIKERITTTTTQQQHKIDIQQVFECVINTTPQNTTTNQHQTHNTIRKFKIWSVLITSLFSSTTKLVMKSNTTYTTQLVNNETKPTTPKNKQTNHNLH